MIGEMIEKGYRCYSLNTNYIKRHIDMIQKRFKLEIVIGGENLLFVKNPVIKNK